MAQGTWMETEMVLTLEMLNRIETRRREWGGGFSITHDEGELLIAAARAHLEGRLAKEMEGELSPRIQPPQQREDAKVIRGEISRNVTPAPSSTVEPVVLICPLCGCPTVKTRDGTGHCCPNYNCNNPNVMPAPSPEANFSKGKSEDAGLVEPKEFPYVRAAFVNAIGEEGTKAEAVEWLQKQWNETCWLRAALEAKDAEIERLKKAYPFHAWSKQKEEAQAEIARLRAFIWDNGLAALESEDHAALKGGDAGRAGRRKP
jgi:hypothetical protein